LLVGWVGWVGRLVLWVGVVWVGVCGFSYVFGRCGCCLLVLLVGDWYIFLFGVLWFCGLVFAVGGFSWCMGGV